MHELEEHDSALKSVQPKFQGIFMYCLGLKKQGFELFLQLPIFTDAFPTETKEHAEKIPHISSGLNLII